MDIINYTEEHGIFRDTMRRFVTNELIPHADEWEEAGIVPRSIWQKMGQQGFLGTSVPAEYGGPGADFLYSVIAIEELARANLSSFSTWLHSDIVVPYIVSFATEEQKQAYLPGCVSGDVITSVAMTEPNAGSDLAAMKTTAVEDGDFVVINGQKTFISNGINCDLCVLAAKDPSEKNPHAAVDLYLVEAITPGFEKGRRIMKAGCHSQDTAELYFTDCRIPKQNRLGDKGTGFLKLMQKLQQERLVCAVVAIAAAEYMLDITMRYCRERTVFGKPISRFQHNQFEIVEMATEIKLGRTFIDKLVVDHMEGRNIVIETSMAKYWMTDMAFKVADRCLQLHGGYGYCDEYPISRAWRDCRAARIFAGTNEIMKVIIARFMGL
ncbi:MAG: acyl-CoA dehydrogenase [Deltaproteobacteria bacterium HGW-Deltaproteobacteria-19]|jgi:acyl-CoA dehydrogenase|nr:MAG: acyl-CoA dehydrogenase [Deltaproteobacteria bacterium HGW-Deltaproteobacteria-19]